MNRFILSLLTLAILNIFTFSEVRDTCISSRVKKNPVTWDLVKIQLEKTSFADMMVIFIHDTAVSTENLKTRLGQDYGELMRLLMANKLQPLKFLAWYYTNQPPWLMDVAVQTSTKPGTLDNPIQFRVVKGGEVLIAHMWGPYNHIGKAYSKIGIWLQENNRLPKGNPFEIYINDPSAVTSPDEIQTDLCQPLE